MKNYIPLLVLVLLGVSILFIAATSQPAAVETTVSIQWLDGKNTVVRVDDINTDDGFLSLHVIDEPVGWMIIPAFSIHWIVAVEVNEGDDTKTIGFDSVDIRNFVRP